MSRIDKYLWHARLFKSRTLAAESVAQGRVRINGQHCSKPAASVKSGDVLTVQAGSRVRILKVIKFAERRGPAAEAQTLYEDITPAREVQTEQETEAAPSPQRKPTRQERKALTELKKKYFDA